MIIRRNYLIIVVSLITYPLLLIYMLCPIYRASYHFIFCVKQFFFDIRSDISRISIHFSQKPFIDTNDTSHLRKIGELEKYALNITNFLIELIIFFINNRIINCYIHIYSEKSLYSTKILYEQSLHITRYCNPFLAMIFLN